MVLVGRSDIGNVTDFIELVSVNYAYKRAGGPIVDWTTDGFAQLQTGDKLYIVGHGGIGTFGAFSVADLVAALTTGPKALVKGIMLDIIFTSCNAGLASATTDSTVSQLRKGLEKANYTGVRVMGACGPSVKSDATGNEYAVIDPDQAKKKQAGALQKQLERLLRPQEKLDQWLATPEGSLASIEKRAEYAAGISQVFYTEYTAELKNEFLVLDHKESITSQRTSGVSPKIATLMLKFGG